MQNLFLFLGEDSYSAHKTIRRWRDEFEKKYGEYNVQIFEGEDLTIEEYLNAVQTLPFASEKKLLIIRDYLASAGNEDQLRMAEELDKLPEHCILVFLEREKPDGRTSLYKKLIQIGQVKLFPELEGYALSQWIINEMNNKVDQGRSGANQGSVSLGGANQGGTNPAGLKEVSPIGPREVSPIGPREAGMLAESVGANLWQMSHELEKIYLYSRGRLAPGVHNTSTNSRQTTTGNNLQTTANSYTPTGNNTPPSGTPSVHDKPIGIFISAQEIEDLISPNLSASIFKLTDSIAAKNPRTALKILNTLLQSGDDIFQVFYMIARQFRILLQIKSCLGQKMTQPKITSKLKEKPFTVMNGIGQCKNFTSAQLTEGYRNLLSIDIALKTGKIRTTTDDAGEFRLALEKLILTLTKC